ncbi:MAG: DUF1684 domain-containing protein [Pseudolysinimonas sp.]
MQPSQLSLVDWRRQVNEMYAAVRDDPDHEAAHTRWRRARDQLFREHPQTPLLADDPLRETGLPYWPYDPAMRFETALLAAEPQEDRVVQAGDDGELMMKLIGRVELPETIGGSLDVWWLRQYGGGIFLPLRDGTSGDGSYGGGRYVLDTAKGSWLGGVDDRIVVDLNFAYHPSCRYNPRWQCPLAPPGNTITARIEAGEQL